MDNTISVILCDDHPLVLDGLKQILSSEKDVKVVASCSGAHELNSYLDINEADVLMLDLHLKDGDGMELCKSLSKKFSSLKIIGLSSVEDTTVISHFLRNGASGYLLKTASADKILEAIRKVHSGNQYLDENVSMAMLLKMNGNSSVQGSSYLPKLSMREKDVLRLIVNERTTQEIADELFISVNTVETHRNHLMQKLGARNLAGLVRIALEKGLLGPSGRP
jgi:DNA-binding NarL/FixJ family response regulator